MTILVTGGAGFIGSNFIIDWLSNSDEKVINIDKLTYAGNLNNLATLRENKKHIFFRVDIGDSKVCRELINKYKPRAIINFAAESHVDRSIDSPEEFIQTNIIGVLRLLDSASEYWQSLDGKQKKIFRFLHVSTDEVYGSLNADEPAFTETNRYKPNSPYSASKASSDHLVRAYNQTYGLPVLTTNCSNNYGPYQFPEKLIPLFINNALAHKALPIYGDGLQVRDWLYVNDHCSAINVVLERGQIGEVYNIGGMNEKTNLQTIDMLCSLLDELCPLKGEVKIKSYRELITYIRDRPGHDRRYAIDSTKIKKELSWEPLENFETGMRKTIEWYISNTKWVEEVTNGQYRKWIERQYA